MGLPLCDYICVYELYVCMQMNVIDCICRKLVGRYLNVIGWMAREEVKNFKLGCVFWCRDDGFLVGISCDVIYC